MAACGKHKEGGMSGPTMNNKVPETKRPALQSNDIMDRSAETKESEVQHILISYQELAKSLGDRMDPRAKSRTKANAEILVARLFKEAKQGADFTTLMKIYSEDPGSAKTGKAYTVEPTTRFVYEFKHLALRLKVGEVGKVHSDFGWHIMKRVE